MPTLLRMPELAANTPEALLSAWLVEEMDQQYLSDPSSVDQAWHEFFADYRPGSPVGSRRRNWRPRSLSPRHSSRERGPNVAAARPVA